MMEMTVDEHIEVLKSYHHGFTGCAGNLQDSIDVAINTMRKYQKIEQIIKNHDNDRMPEDYWYIDRIREVLEDGAENNHHASNT